MKITGILVQLTLVLAILTSCMAKEKSVEKPNIIYILADDLGYAEVGCYGQEKIETTNGNYVISDPEAGNLANQRDMLDLISPHEETLAVTP